MRVWPSHRDGDVPEDARAVNAGYFVLLVLASRSETRMRLNVGDDETAAASEGLDLGRCATLLGSG